VHVWCGEVSNAGHGGGGGGSYWAAIGRRDRLFGFYIQTENIKHFEHRAVSQCTVRMPSGWVIAPRHSSCNLAHART
jgi:hypothetical protein